MTITPPRRAALAGLLLLALGTTAGCSGGASSDSAAGGGVDSGLSAAEPAPAVGAAGGEASGAKADRAAAVDTTPAVISTGSVELTADDVPDARLDVLAVVARYGGQVADEQATTDPDAPAPDTPVSSGAPESASAIARTHLVVRIPSRDFDRAMRDLAGIGHFVASSRQAQDVTTEVIDLRARIRVQAASVARIETLLGRADDIKDVVAVEAQLSRRQADLESLRGRAAYLADQTTLATITVDLSRRTSADKREESPAFVAGLSSGWHGLTTLLGGLLTALGALLPFLIVLVPLALVLWLVRRTRLRLPGFRDGPGGPPQPAAGEGSESPAG